MDNEEIRTLQILEQIENDDSVSQRKMASNLNVSLGLVNSFIKRLVKKGYIKVSTIPRKRIIYLLTPKGAAEKTALTYEYIKHSFSFYRNTRERLLKLFNRIYEDGIRNIAFFGVSELTEIAYVTIQQTPLKLIAIYDCYDGKFMGIEISNIENVKKILFDKILITELNKHSNSIQLLINVVDKSKIIEI